MENQYDKLNINFIMETLLRSIRSLIIEKSLFLFPLSNFTVKKNNLNKSQFTFFIFWLFKNLQLILYFTYLLILLFDNDNYDIAILFAIIKLIFK